MAGNKDRLFDNDGAVMDFSFDGQTAAVFDDMLSRSVPLYEEVVRMMGDILEAFLKPKDIVYDLGSSTGRTLLELSGRLDGLDVQWIGYDLSDAMVWRAREKASLFHREHVPDFRVGDITAVGLDQCGAVLLNYTLQFLRPIQRPEFLYKVFSSLRPGGVCLITEKTIVHDSDINRAYIDFYLRFKRRMGYSELEIARKREALENVLVPFSAAENIAMLKKAGFARVEQFFQWFNFSGFCAVKD